MTAPKIVSAINDKAIDRFRILSPFLYDETSLIDVSRISGIPEPTLRRWLARYRRHGMDGLHPRRRCDRGQRRAMSDEMLALVEGLALQRPRQSVAAIHRSISKIAAEKSIAAPSYATVYGIIKKLDPAMIVLAQEGVKAYAHQYDLLHRREASGPNEIWQADHTELDILIRDASGGAIRPWLTIVIDDYSRAIAAFHVSAQPPNALQTALALRRAIWRKSEASWSICGIPAILYTDHGSNFTSKHIEQVCAALKTRLIFS